jgi:hypothetical protein
VSKPNSKEKANPNLNSNSSKWVPVEAPPQIKPLTPEWAALKFLEDWTPNDIELAIKKNFEIDLGPFWSYVESIVIKEVLNWFKTYRPDLHKVLATEDGIRWLKMNIRKMTTQI